MEMVFGASTSDAAVKNLPAGWTVETVYEKPVTPSSLCLDGNGDLLMLDPVNREISKLTPDGNLTSYILTGSVDLDIIAFQPNANQLIGINDDTSLYAYEAGAFTLINSFDSDKGISSSVEVDPTDDSFYGGSFQTGSKICQFNASGDFIREIVSNVQGCGQIALNKSQNILYYSEAYTGNIYRVNLTDLSSTAIATGLGIPSIGECPVMCIDDNGTLYSLHKNGTTNQGLYKLVGDSFVFSGLPDKYGWGPLHWAPKFQKILLAGSAGGCIAAYDLVGSKIEKLTETVNSPAIVETADGLILLSIEKQILKLTDSGLVNLTNVLPFDIKKFALDAASNIYAGVANDTVTILRVHPNGSYYTWFSEPIHESLESLCFDSKYNTMVVVTSNATANYTAAYRISIDNASLYEPVIDPVITGSVSRGTVDRNGTIYIYENQANVIYRIPDWTMVPEILFTDVHYEDPFFFLQYSSMAHGLIGGWNDGLRIFPLPNGTSYSFADSDTGIDFQSLFETQNLELIGTHTRHIYRLRYEPGGNISGFEWVPLILSLLALVYVFGTKKTSLMGKSRR